MVGVAGWAGYNAHFKVSRPFHEPLGPAWPVSRAFHARNPLTSTRSERLGPVGGGVNPIMRTLTP